MTKLAALLLPVLLCACGARLESGPIVVCETIHDECPVLNALHDVGVFYESVPGFDMDRDLTIHWHDHDQRWHIGDIEAVGYTSNPDEVDVTSDSVLIHELTHVTLWRDLPDSYGDPDHEQGAGPWNEYTNELIAEIIGRL